MVKRAILLFALAASAVASSAETYSIRPVYSTAGFKITKWMVLPEEGQFRDFTGSVTYDPAHPEQSHIEITVQARSIDTKNDTRDGVVCSHDFFDVEKYPMLSFRSVVIKI